MTNTTRRIFFLRAAAGASLLTVSHAMAQALPMVNEKDVQAAALGYAAETTTVDLKKYPKHAKEQKCSSCQLYSGKANETAGPCPLFAGKQVAANGWCSAYIKKAG